jgi:hypothetical protein
MSGFIVVGAVDYTVLNGDYIWESSHDEQTLYRKDADTLILDDPYYSAVYYTPTSLACYNIISYTPLGSYSDGTGTGTAVEC